MINWTKEELEKVQEHYQKEYDEAEDKIDESSYPPGEQLQMDKSEAIIRLLRNMMDEKSWTYKLGHS
jgi:hypothetical protein